MDEVKLFSKDVICICLYNEGKFTIGRTYHLVYNRMNDIVWYHVQDDDHNRLCLHENGWQKYFKEI